MIYLDLFRDRPLSNLQLEITRYVNKNVEDIIRCLLDFLEDDNDFTSDDFLPYNNIKISNDEWIELVNNLYELVSSRTIRDYIKPIYEYLIYVILQWWEDCADAEKQLLTNEMDDKLYEKVSKEFVNEDGENFILKAITNYHEYYYILFADHDFLPNTLEPMVIMFLESPEKFAIFYSDVDLADYELLMPADLREQFRDIVQENKCDTPKGEEENLLEDLAFCCEIVQSGTNFEITEDELNDRVRDLLRARYYEVYDQTRRGKSATGKRLGEVDLLIRDKNNFPISIIEALKLTYVNTDYISEHIDKMYKYDTLGQKFNFLLAYVSCADFNCFWKAYIEYLKSQEYLFHVIRMYELGKYTFSNFRCLVIEMERNGIITRLYALAVYFQKINRIKG